LTTIALVVFWGSVALIIYIYIGFPLLLMLRGLLFPVKLNIQKDDLPSISIIIAAYNEAENIVRKLHNTLSLDYPSDKVQIIIASDGSEDGTNELVEQYPSEKIQFLKLPRQGKNRTINTAVQEATNDVLVFSDADSMLDKAALRHLVAPLGDPRVGAIGGNYFYATDVTEGEGERSYWGIDRLLKTLQSRTGSMTSATGQIFAIQRSLFKPVPLSVTDDFYISTQAPSAHLRLFFEPKAIARGPVAGSSKSEYRRKVRVITRGLNSVRQMKHLLNPFQYGFYAVQLLSHKVLRRMVFIPLLAMPIALLFLAQESLVYLVFLVLQLGFHGLGLLSYMLQNTKLGRLKPLSLILFFEMVNVACAVATSNILRGKKYDVWIAERSD